MRNHWVLDNAQKKRGGGSEGGSPRVLFRAEGKISKRDVHQTKTRRIIITHRDV
jgi:hypothetical protein